MAIGGAAINREAEIFLKKSGFPYLIGYGLTESAPLLAGGPWADPTIAVGSTGKPIPGVEIKIAGSRSPHRHRRNPGPRPQCHEGILQEPPGHPRGDG